MLFRSRHQAFCRLVSVGGPLIRTEQIGGTNSRSLAAALRDFAALTLTGTLTHRVVVTIGNVIGRGMLVGGSTGSSICESAEPLRDRARLCDGFVPIRVSRRLHGVHNSLIGGTQPVISTRACSRHATNPPDSARCTLGHAFSST